MSRYEIVTRRGRAYADDMPQVLEHLIPGYRSLTPADAAAARYRSAVDAQVAVQANLNARAEFAACSEHGRTILTGHRHDPPSVPHWDEPVPLVLVATQYEPAGMIARPRPVDGRGPNVWWIDPSSDESLLRTLHEVGSIAVGEEDPDAMP